MNENPGGGSSSTESSSARKDVDALPSEFDSRNRGQPAPFPPVQGKPPAHYLKGPREPWRSWVNAEHSGMGPIGAHRESFDHKGHK